MSRDDSDFWMYLQAQKRYAAVTDAVFRHLADGDVLGLLEFVANVANGCDYVDDELIELHRRAVERWPAIEDGAS